MALRSRLQACTVCSFHVEITADYGNEINQFRMDCQGDSQGNLTFTVTEPETLAGVSGRIDGAGGKLTFDDAAVHFKLLAEGQVTPVSGPWLLLRALQGGYLRACGEEDGFLRLTVHDSYEEDALQLEVWLNAEDMPVQGEILFDGRRIVTMLVENFEIR